MADILKCVDEQTLVELNSAYYRSQTKCHLPYKNELSERYFLAYTLLISIFPRLYYTYIHISSLILVFFLSSKNNVFN